MFAQLGIYEFKGVFGPSQVRTSSSVNNVEIGRVQGKPLTQAVGENLTTIDMSITLSNAWCDPMSVFESLKADMNNREVLPLIWGDGTVEGDFLIEEIGKEEIQRAPNGDCVLIQVQLSLKEYVTTATSAPSGFALASKSPLKAASLPAVSNPAVAVMNNISTAKQAATRLQRIVSMVQRGAAGAQQAAKQVGRALEKGKAALKEAERISMEAEKIQTVAQAGINNMRTMQNNFQNAIEAVTDTPISAAKITDANRSLQFGMTNLSSSTTAIVNLGAAGK